MSVVDRKRKRLSQAQTFSCCIGYYFCTMRSLPRARVADYQICFALRHEAFCIASLGLSRVLDDLASLIAGRQWGRCDFREIPFYRGAADGAFVCGLLSYL